MSNTTDIRVLTAEERAELKRRAKGATPGPHERYSEDDGNFAESRTEWETVGPARFYGDNQMADASYYAAVSPDLTLGTLAYVEQTEARVRELAARVSSLQAELAEQERAALGWAQENAELRKSLFKSLSVLAGMWNQYCPPPTEKCPYPGHMFMSAGEDAEELLEQWGLLRPNETAIDCDFKDEFEEAPEKVKALLTGCNPPAAGLSPSSQDPAGAEPWRAVFVSEAEYDASVKSVVARINSGEVKPIEPELEAGSPAPEGEPARVPKFYADGWPHEVQDLTDEQYAQFAAWKAQQFGPAPTLVETGKEGGQNG
jgi:hypothetical protein